MAIVNETNSVRRPSETDPQMSHAAVRVVHVDPDLFLLQGLPKLGITQDDGLRHSLCSDSFGMLPAHRNANRGVLSHIPEAIFYTRDRTPDNLNPRGILGAEKVYMQT